MEKDTIIITLVVSLIFLFFISFIIWAFFDYDEPCLDKVSNKICMEEGFVSGEHYFTYNPDLAYCYKDRVYQAIELKLTEQEIEECKRW